MHISSEEDSFPPIITDIADRHGLGSVLQYYGSIKLNAILALVLFAQIPRNLHVYVCEAGLIYQKQKQDPQPFRWDEIQTVWRVAHRHSTESSSHSGHSTEYWVSYEYIIQRNDGYKIVLRGLQGMYELELLLTTQIKKTLLPSAIEAYTNGQTVTFGPLSVNQQGISDGRNLLPWVQIENIFIWNHGAIGVKRRREGGMVPWSTVAAGQIPNFFVFQALVEHIQQQKAEAD